MGLFKGGALRLVQTGLYLLIFCCSGIILGLYSYFLAVQADRDARIPRWQQAVEGISGAAVLYSICAILLTCCLGGVSFFAFLGLALDIAFVGGMIAIAVLTRDGAGSCKGHVNTPLGPGNTNSNNGEFGNSGFGTGSGENVTYSVSTRTACRFNTVCFAVSIIAAFLFIITAGMQIFLARHHKKEKRYGPSPSNNYTSGPAKRKFWQRKPKTTKDAELGMTGTAVGAGGLAVPTTHNNRASHETGYTGSTVAAPANSTYDKTDAVHGKHAPHGSHGGYYTQPQGTGVNPYGYDATTTTAPHTNNAATNY